MLNRKEANYLEYLFTDLSIDLANCLNFFVAIIIELAKCTAVTLKYRKYTNGVVSSPKL